MNILRLLCLICLSALLSLSLPAAYGQTPGLLAWWNFNNAANPAVSADVVHGYVGNFLNGAHFTAAAGGRTGAGSDRAADFSLPVNDIMEVASAPWLNQAGAVDKLTICFWQKLTQRTEGATFQLISPTREFTRAAHAHCPYLDDNIYWRTGGDDPTAFSIHKAQPAGFNYSVWHHFVFVKDGDAKSIWVDGQSIASSTNTANLAGDMTGLVLGSLTNPSRFQMMGYVDDFAIFKSALSTAHIQALAAGTPPDQIGVPSTSPDINATPAQLDYGLVNVGQTSNLMLTIQNTGTAALNVTALNSSSARWTTPGTTPPLNIAAGSSRQVTVRYTPLAGGIENATLTVLSNDPDQASVRINLAGHGQTTPGYTLTVSASPAAGGTVTGAGTFASGTNTPITATANAGYQFVNWTGAGVANPNATSTTVSMTANRSVTANFSTTPPSTSDLLAWWNFNDAANPAVSADVVHGYVGNFLNGAHFTAAAGGRTGAGSDRAADFSLPVNDIMEVASAPWLNQAGAVDKLTICFWQKLTQRTEGATFQLISPTREFTRAAHAHCPYLDDNIYWRTGGDDPTAFSIHKAQPAGFNYSVWHHFVFVKDGDAKSIWVDGQSIASSTNTANLAGDMTGLVLGSLTNPSRFQMMGYVDDFAIYKSALSAAHIQSLATGTPPDQIGNPVTAPDINITPQFGLDFGDVAVGQTKNLAFSVQNTGTGDLTVTAMNLSAAPSSQWFSRVTPALPFTVAAGGSTQVTVRCAPTAVRVEIGDFDLISNDPDESPKNVEMSANGTAAVTPPPATAGVSDSFNRGDSDPCNLGRADISFGGAGNHYYVPIFPGSGARISGQKLVNVTQDYGGAMFSAQGGCTTSGENIGRVYNIAVRLRVPTDSAQRITQAGPFFHSRPAFAYDGIIGGGNAGYWVQLHSTGEVKVKNLNSTLIVATSGVPPYFDPAASHQLEIAVQETSLQVALDGRHLWFTQDAQLVPVISTPATAGTDGGSAGVAFGCEPNRGLIGGQWADNLVVGPYRSLLTLPDQDNSQPPPAATLSDSFNRANATECLLGAANHALGGSGNHFYLPVFANGAILSGNTLRNPGLDYSGLQFTASANCTGRGENLGTTLNMAMKLLVPPGVGGGITEAGPYFGNRASAVHDGILGGSSAGYWVRLHSDGSVTVKNCNSLLTVTSTGTPGSFDANAWHRFEIALSGSSLQVALDGRRVTFKEGGQQVTTLTLPASGGSPAGAAGIAFGCEQNRGQAGGQQADDIVLTAFRSLTSLPVQNNFTTPAPLVLTCPTPDTLRITWPQSGYEGYLLEISDDFASGWVPLLLPNNTLGSQYIVEFDMTAESRFYRLVKP